VPSGSWEGNVASSRKVPFLLGPQPDFERGESGETCELLHTSRVAKKMRVAQKKCNFESARQRGSAQSMRDSAQVTAPGAIANMIAAVSTRPNRQNRSTCSCMSVPLVQKHKLGLVNR
jgi:hypothetical protein